MRKLFTLLILLFLWAGSSWGQNLSEGFENTAPVPPDGWLVMYANPSPPTGNLVSHTTTYFYEGARSFRFSSYSLGSPYDQYLITPELDVTEGDQTFSFYYRRYTSGTETFRVGWSSTGTSLDDFTWSSNITDATTTWQEYSKIDLPVGTKYVAVHYLSNYEYYLYIDQVYGPALAPPSAPNCATLVSPADAATNVFPSATLNWASGGGSPTGYNLYFGANELPATPIDLGLVTTYDPAGDMDFSTTYYWKVVPYNDYGPATGCPTWTFTTAPDPTVTVFPFTEGFEGAAFPPYGWTVIDNNADNDKWILSTSNPRTGLQCARILTDFNTVNDDYLVTPPVALTGNQELKFWARAHSASEPDEISILLSSTTPTPEAFTTVVLSSVAVNSTSYVEYSVDLSAYSGTVYLSFTRKDSPADGWYLYLDDVLIRDIPATPTFMVSPASKDFASVVIGNSSASQTFTISNTGGGTLTLNPATSIIGTDANQFVLSDGNLYPLNLTAGQSATVGVVFTPTTSGFKTANLNFTHNATGSPSVVALSGTALPEGTLFESFEATTFPPAGWANPGTWSRSTSYSYEGVASAYKYTTATASLLRTPLVSINSSSALTFYARTSTTSIYQRIQVQYSDDGTTWTNIGSEIELPSAGAFALYTIDLSSIPADDYYLAFSTYYATGGSGGSVYIDYITGPVTASVVPDAVTLVAPADAATNVSITPSLSWTPAATGGVPTGYKIYLDENPNPTTLLTTVTASPYVVATPLDYLTTYYWKVVATNATGDGEASVVRSFTTLADPTLTPPFTQTFDTYPPLNWTETSGLLADPSVLTGTSSAWTVDGFANVGTTGSARLEIWSTGLYAWMITPPIDLGDGSTDYELRFDLALTFWNSTGPANTTGVDDKFAVVISTDNGQTWSSANTLRLWDNAGSPYVYNNISNTGETIILDLSAYSGVIKIGFYGESTISNADNNVYVDNVIVQEPPTCEMPLSVNVPTYTLNSATITWTAAIPAPANGYEWQVLDASLAVVASGATAAGVTTANATGLAANTSYTAVVRSVCAVNDYSAWTSPVPFYTGYCIPAPTSVDGQGITNVTFSTVNNTTGAETGNYGDYSAQIGDVNRDATVPVAITFQTGYTYDTKIWIDWNDDLDFSDAGEEVYSGTSLATNPTTLAASFIVPSDAPLGNHRMRIGSVDAGPPTPCYTGSYGSYEDYTVNVLEALPTEMVRGEVTDCYTGAFLEGVSVSIAGLTTTTDVNGYYEFPEVNIGTYDLSASLSGYFSKTITGVVVTEGATTTQDLCLNIYVDPPLDLQASVENQDVHLTWLAPDALENAFVEDFEAGTLPTGWLAIDNDGDAFNWINTIEQAFGFDAHAGSGAMTSASYDNTAGALTPDNWLITPAISVTATSDLSWWHDAQDADYPDEQYYVKISTTGTALTDFTTTLWSGVTPGDWALVTVSLSAYAGQTVYIAWQHTDVTDMFWMKLDDVVVTNTATRSMNTPIISNRTSNAYPFKTAGLTPEQIEEKLLVFNNNVGVRSNREMTGYNVYKDEAFLAFTTLTEYDDLNLPAGTYSYTVTAVYSEGESEPAGPVTVEIITCNVPTNVQVTEFDQTSATIEWTAPDPAPANGYEYEVRTDGDPGSGATGLAASGTTAAGVTTANITGLEDGTIYMVYVRSVCGNDNYSNWTGGVEFATSCFALNLPFAEDFEESSATLLCWSRYDADGGGEQWSWYNGLNHTPDGELAFGHPYGDFDYAEDGWLISPALIIPETGNTELKFWSYNIYPGDYFKNSVLISTGSPDPSDEQYTEIWSPESVSATWVETVIDLNAYAGETIYIAFRYEGTFAHSWLIDDVSVSLQTPPTKTLNLTDVIIEGLYSGSGLMHEALDENGLPEFGAGIADEITVELHSATSYSTIEFSLTVQLSISGTATVDDIPSGLNGSYYITVKHRNSIETTSASPISFSGDVITQSFGLPANIYGGNLQYFVDGVYAIYSGDIFKDGIVDTGDMSEIDNNAAIFATGYLITDVDGSGLTDTADMTIVDNNSALFVGAILP